ncbi:hypothetical protein D3C75_1329730 [compost metagenome]
MCKITLARGDSPKHFCNPQNGFGNGRGHQPNENNPHEAREGADYELHFHACGLGRSKVALQLTSGH